MKANCETLERFLNEQEHGGGQEALPAALRQHLDLCDTCRRAWAVQQSMLAALESEPDFRLPPEFTSRVMSRLPATPPRPAWDFEPLLIPLLVAAGLGALWLTAGETLARFFSSTTLEGVFDPLRQFGSDLLVMMGKWRGTLTSAFGDQIFAQGRQVAIISLVTYLVAKGALLLESRLRRLIRGL